MMSRRIEWGPVVGIMAPIALAGLLALGCGPPAIDASKVKTLQVVATGPKAFCPMTKTPLGVEAVMNDGVRRATHAKERKSQFNADELQWTVTPSGLGKVVSDGTEIAFTSTEDLSPLLEKDATLDVTMKKNLAVKATFDIAPDFSCPQVANWGAPSGNNGYQGEEGISGGGGSGKKVGGTGGRGGDGEPGKSAGPLEVAIKLIDTPKRGKLAAVRIARASDGDSATYFLDPVKGRISILNRGGNGGAGGIGGFGGFGDSGHGACKSGSAGGNGGDGGNGSAGGDGGSVMVRFDAGHPELKDLIKIDNAGGMGGAPGAGGNGGQGGGGGDRKSNCEPAAGPSGHDGHPGGRGGNKGHDGPAPQFLAESPDRLFPDNAYAAKRHDTEKTAARAPKSAEHAQSHSAFTPPAGASGAGGVPVAAFKLGVTDPEAKLKSIEMKANGTVLFDDRPGAKLVDDRLVDASGNPVLTVAADGVVTVVGKDAFHLKFAGDDLFLSDKGKISVGDDGTVRIQTGPGDGLFGKLEGPAKSKRAIALTIMALAVQPTLAERTTASAGKSTAKKR